MTTKTVLSIKKVGIEHTWDVSTTTETYLLSNGCISHNTSAQLSNSTNGIEPVRSLITEKESKHGILKQVVPEINKLKNKYDLLWNQKSVQGYLKITLVLQKFMDQALSVNTSYNPQHYENNEISMQAMIEDILMFYKYGGKNLYYFNTYDGQGNEEEMDNAKLEKLTDDDSCEGCKL